MQNNDFNDVQNLVKELLRNNEVLTRQETAFNACVAPLSEARRRVVYGYIATLKERIRLLTERVEEQERGE